MVTDSCDPMKYESLQTGLSRWVCHDSPLPSGESPAFPHKGTCMDVEKLKQLLNKLVWIFPKGTHTYSSLFSHHSQNGTMAASKQTAEEAAHQATLKYMVHVLKHLGSLFLVNNCALPTVHEVRLYGLILRQIESYMLMYQMEENSKQDAVSSELVDQAVKQVGCFLTENHIDVDETVMKSFEDWGNDFDAAWKGFELATILFQDYRSSISKMSHGEGAALFETAIDGGTTDVKSRVAGHVSTPDPLIFTKTSVAGDKTKYSEGDFFDTEEAMKKTKLNTAAFDIDQMSYTAMKSDGKVISVDDRMELLLNVLKGLGNIGRMRSYAPPLHEEMNSYRLIWVYVMFSLGLINSKCRSGTAPTSPWGKTDWVFDLLGSFETLEGLDAIPNGWKLTFTLGTIPDLIALMIVCKDHLSKSLRYNRCVSQDGVMEIDSESQETLQNHHSHGFDTVAANMYFAKLLPQNDEGKSMAKTRSELLCDILCILKSINWNGLPTTVERRFHSRLIGHVHSSIWMYESEKWTKEFLPSWFAGHSIHSTKQKPLVGTAENADVMGGREKSREQCLREIVLFVEAIESSFLDSVPTAQEMSCYREIERHMHQNFMRTAHSLMTQIFPMKPQLQLHHIALMDHHVKCIFDLMRKQLEPVERLYREMLAIVIPISDWKCGEKFIGAMSSEDEVALKALVDERLRDTWKEVVGLDVAITILDGARACADDVYGQLCNAEVKLSSLTQFMRYEECIDEVCHVPGIWDRLLEHVD